MQDCRNVKIIACSLLSQPSLRFPCRKNRFATHCLARLTRWQASWMNYMYTVSGQSGPAKRNWWKWRNQRLQLPQGGSRQHDVALQFQHASQLAVVQRSFDHFKLDLLCHVNFASQFEENPLVVECENDRDHNSCTLREWDKRFPFFNWIQLMR